MDRAPFQVLVFLRRVADGASEYLLLKRSDMDVWQGVAGGGEGEETPSEAAIRETFEETGVLVLDVIDLESVEMLSVPDVAGYYRWGEEIKTIPEYAFYADIACDVSICISEEHTKTTCNDSRQRTERYGVAQRGVRMGKSIGKLLSTLELIIARLKMVSRNERAKENVSVEIEVRGA